MFTIMFDDAAEHLALRARTLSAVRVLMILPRYLSHQEWRRIDQRGVAELLQTTQASISRGLDELLDLGVIEKRRAGSNLEWRLSPDYTWRGSVDSYHTAAESRRKLKFGPPATGPKVAEEILWNFLLRANGTQEKVP